MHHVVIGIDDNAEHALAYVEEVAKLPGKLNEKEATPVHSFTDSPSGASATQIRSVREVGEFLEDRGIEYDISESSGDPVEITIEFADEEDADLIVTAGRKRSPAGRTLFGSVTQTVTSNLDRLVMVTGPMKRER